MLHFLGLVSLLLWMDHVLTFDVNRNDNLAIYWGQDSYGATHSDSANFQKTLSFYCQDNSVDIFPIAFLDQFFTTGNLPHIDLTNICNANTGPVFAGSQLANCQFLATDIQTCQARGKIVTLSIGGGAASGVFFTSASQASTFADQIWNLFLGGSSTTRPFGNAVLDGIDLDIEGGSTQFYDTFINRIRTHTSGASKKYYITGAPQCPFPDAFMSPVLNAVAFDMVYVQFYNNFCGLTNFNNPMDWNFAQWDTWVKTTAVNKNTKIFIGAPGAPSAAGSGYVDASTLGNIIEQTRASFSTFGGVMMWDMSQAFQNNRYDAAIKSFLTGGGGVVSPANSTTAKPPSTTASPSSTVKTTTTTTRPPSSGSCSGVPAWVSSVAYPGGSQVVFNSHLWTANWWSEADAPGGAAGDWTDNGPCTSANVAVNSAGVNPAAHTSEAKTKENASVSAKATAVKTATQPAKTDALATKTAGANTANADTLTSAAGETNARRSRIFRPV